MIQNLDCALASPNHLKLYHGQMLLHQSRLAVVILNEIGVAVRGGDGNRSENCHSRCENSWDVLNSSLGCEYGHVYSRWRPTKRNWRGDISCKACRGLVSMVLATARSSCRAAGKRSAHMNQYFVTMQTSIAWLSSYFRSCILNFTIMYACALSWLHCLLQMIIYVLNSDMSDTFSLRPGIP